MNDHDYGARGSPMLFTPVHPGNVLQLNIGALFYARHFLEWPCILE